MLSNGQILARQEQFNDMIRDVQRYQLARSIQPVQPGLVHKYILSIVKLIRPPKLDVVEARDSSSTQRVVSSLASTSVGRPS